MHKSRGYPCQSPLAFVKGGDCWAVETFVLPIFLWPFWPSYLLCPLFPVFGPLPLRGLLSSHASPLYVLGPRLLLSAVLIRVWPLVSTPVDTILSVLSPRLSQTPSELQ